MTWVEGRKLDTVTVNGQTYTYVYNADGQRVKKIHPDGSFIEYYVMDGVTVGESHFTATGNKTLGIRYALDENSNVIGFTTGGQNYYFIKNLQSDVLAVYRDADNAVVAEYTYDSWGNVLTATGSLADINPFRYRSYYYDEETDFYYISSRYYDPEIGRFVNADVFPSTGQGIIGTNMFAYCGNNPVNRVDIGGYFWDTVFDVLSLVSSVAEVVSNPTDVGAWVGLAGDLIDVAVPMVGGVGESVRAVNSARKVADTVDTVHDAGKVLDGAADAGKALGKAGAVAQTTSTAKIGWELGDDITNLTKAGNNPSWATVRQRYWKNEAYYFPEKYTSSNLEIMKKGQAPLVMYDGKTYSMELHHINPRRNGGSNAYSNLLPVTPWEHAAIDPYRHFNP